MPLFSSKLELSTAASASKIVLADVDLIKGAFKVYPSLSTIQGESVNYFADNQIVMAGDTSRLYQATITPADFITVFEDSASFTEFTFTGLSADVPSGTISGSAQIAALGYLLSSQTSSFVLSSQTSSFALKTDVSGAFTSVSSSVSVRLTSLEAGGGSVPSGTISSSQQITNFGFISSSAPIASEISGAFTSVSGGLESRITTLEGTSGGSTDITALNSFTSSAQSNLNALNAATSSYLTAASTSSLALKTDVSGAFTAVSGGLELRITNLELGGGSVPAGTISSSTQITELGFVNSSQTSSMVVSASLTASFISDAFISASAVRSGFGTATLPSGVLSSSAQIATDISGAFTEVSSSVSTRLTTLETTSGGSTDITALNTFTGSIQSEVNALKAATSSYITSTQTGSFILVSQTSSMSVATASYVSPAFISASAAAAGFGTGASTDITSLNTFTGSIQSEVNALKAATSSYITSVQTGSFILVSQTSSMVVSASLTASYINPSALPSGLVSSSTQTIANLVGTGILSGSSTVPAGTVSSSAQVVANLIGQNVVVNTITAQQYVVSSSVSFITTSFSSGSTKFGDDLNDTHQFTGSLSITGSLNIGGPFTVNNENLNVSSGSIILTNSSSIVVLDSGIISGTFVGNLNYNYITNLPNLISSSAQIAALGAGLLSSSAQISSEISGAFTSLSASFAARLDSLSVGGGIFQLTGSSYNTTNNIQITGSFSVGTTSFKGFEVNNDGFVVLGNKADTSTAPAGTIVYSGSDFYLIV
jgi:hypothetical protein